MNGALRLHDHLDAVVRHAEQVMRLYDLEAFVHKRRRVDGNLGTHVPGGMRKRLLGSHARQLVTRLSSEGAAARRDPQRRDFCRTLPQIPDTFIGIGGGQTCDINKAVGATFRKAFFSVPTALTTDAPTSTHTIINNPHEQPRLMVHYKNPDYVVVDTEITVQAPAWMMVSGIGDALATYIEAQASFANNNVCNAGAGDYRPTLMAMSAAKLSYEILLEEGRSAIRAARQHLRTPAYEDVVEATVLLSGLGFECTGVSIAHGLQAGFHVLPVKPLLHGTGVGYCTLIQLIVQNDSRFGEIFSFCRDIGLPVCTQDLGLTPENRDASICALVDEVYGKRWNVANVPHYFSRQTLIDAIYYLDAYAAEQA